MEFNEQEFLNKLDKVTSSAELRALIDSIPLTAYDLAELEQMESHRLTITALRTPSTPSI
jgi:hypothetical protein